MIFGEFFNRKTSDEKLEDQRKKLSDLQDIVKECSDEIATMKNQLVRKANGSLYPHLAKAGVKIAET